MIKTKIFGRMPRAVPIDLSADHRRLASRILGANLPGNLATTSSTGGRRSNPFPAPRERDGPGLEGREGEGEGAGRPYLTHLAARGSLLRQAGKVESRQQTRGLGIIGRSTETHPIRRFKGSRSLSSHAAEC